MAAITEESVNDHIKATTMVVVLAALAEFGVDAICFIMNSDKELTVPKTFGFLALGVAIFNSVLQCLGYFHYLALHQNLIKAFCL